MFDPLLIFLFMTKRGERFDDFVFTLNPLLMIDKKGERYLLCMHVFIKEFMFMHICFVLQIGEKDFVILFYVWLACLLLHLHTCLWAFIAYLLFICDAWVKGELLWRFTLIHAYITPWVLSSSKRGRLLARKPITLVLMMINSCSYSTNDLVFN